VKDTYWHFDNFSSVTSYLTGRTIFINNDHRRFLISPEKYWNTEQLTSELSNMAASHNWNHRTKRSVHILSILDDALCRPSHQTIASAIDMIMGGYNSWSVMMPRDNAVKRQMRQILKPWHMYDKTRISEWLTVLWRAGVIALPRNKRLFLRTNWVLGTSSELVIGAALKAEGVRENYQIAVMAMLDDMLLRICGHESVGDLVPEVLTPLKDMAQNGGYYTKLRGFLVRCQIASHGTIKHSEHDYWPRPPTFSTDTEFRWAIAEDASLIEWSARGAKYIADSRTNIPGRMQSLRAFLQTLILNKDIPRRPDLLFTRTHECSGHFDNISDEHYNTVSHFFDWLIERELSEVRADGLRVPLPGIRNPFQKRRTDHRLVESVRDAMPSHLLQMMIEVLTEDDWAWARRAKGLPGTGRMQGADWFRWQDPETGEWTDVWSPVCAIALYAKLMFPARTAQIRFLDSGESDEMIPDLDQMKMVPNPAPVQRGTEYSHPRRRAKKATARAPSGHIAQRGAVQIVRGRNEGYLTLKFTTNKTADISKSSWERGYTSPWMPKDLAIEFVRLREWQAKMNPITGPRLWTEVAEFRIGSNAKHSSVLAGMESTFLFRDRTHKDPRRREEPIGAGKVDVLYVRLCAEVERRCTAAGMTGPDGKPVRLIASINKRGMPSGLIYPLHALRVSIITHFIEDGEVRPEVMMKIVGHATVVMTLYYIKHSREYIADTLLRGDTKRIAKARDAWVVDARSKEIEDLRRLAVSQSDSALNAFVAAPSGSLAPMNIGICPVARRRCDEGGKRLLGRQAEEVYAPVPGGQSNCAGCRFLVSGEPWLEGLSSEFNLRSLDVSLKNRHLDRINQLLLPLDDERREAMGEGRPFFEFQEWQSLKNQVAEIEARLEQLHAEMANLLILSEQVSAIAKERMNENDTRVALVVGDITAVETALQESTEYDLVDRICQSTIAFPSLAARGTVTETATLFRARAWDLVLKRHGLEPRFLDLDVDLAMYVGNRLSQWLDMRVGRPNTLRLMAGDTLSKICQETGLLPESVLHDLEIELNSAVAQELKIVAEPARLTTA